MKETAWLSKYDWYEFIKILSDEEAGQLYKALFAFAVSGEDPEKDGKSPLYLATLQTAKKSIEKDMAAYQAKCETNRQNRLKAEEKKEKGKEKKGKEIKINKGMGDEEKRPSTNVNDGQRWSTTVNGGQPRGVVILPDGTYGIECNV